MSTRTGTKLLGFAVWQGAKWYLRRRVSEARQKLVMAGFAAVLAAVVVGLIVAAQRHHSARQS